MTNTLDDEVPSKPNTRKTAIKAVPAAAFKNAQLDMFQGFLANTDNERKALSNAIDLWDSTPRYSIPRAKQDVMRLEGGFLPVYKTDFQHRGTSYGVQIRPARIEARDADGNPTGETVEYYPSSREELIELALRKLATDQNAGFHDQVNYRSGVAFTLYQLRAELAERGHAMGYLTLVEGLDILNLSNIRITDKTSNIKDPSLISQSFFPVLIKVNKEMLAADPDSKWLVQFHSALTVSINLVSYRQFNYARLMRCRLQLSRWLISQLVLKYVQASVGNTFTLLYSTVKRDSGLLNYNQQRDSIAALDDALEEIKREDVLMHIKKEPRTGLRGKIEEVTYTLMPSTKFAAEQKAANKRKSNSTGIAVIPS